MPSALPDGDPAPPRGSSPPALAHLGTAPFGVYVHVPFCAVRCGYCDFNTYTLGSSGDTGAGTETFAAAALAELDLAATVLGSAPGVDTVFVGGGTPTLLAAADLVEVLGGIRERWGLAPDAEVTTEANPDSVTRESLRVLAAGGFTRISLGMQSAVPHVLAVLDRTHDPAGVARAVGWAREAGLAVSVDLIYGTPGEGLDDWRTSLEAAVALEPDHVSAYALVVEEGTKLAAQVRRGSRAGAARRRRGDQVRARRRAARRRGLRVVRGERLGPPADRCRHNVGYWAGGDWWGVGPGAHSHVGGVRWWNVKHPAAYAARLPPTASPGAAREVLTPEQRLDERVLLGVRLVEGLPLGALDEVEGAALGRGRAHRRRARRRPRGAVGAGAPDPARSAARRHGRAAAARDCARRPGRVSAGRGSGTGSRRRGPGSPGSPRARATRPCRRWRRRRGRSRAG